MAGLWFLGTVPNPAPHSPLTVALKPVVFMAGETGERIMPWKAQVGSWFCGDKSPLLLQ